MRKRRSVILLIFVILTGIRVKNDINKHKSIKLNANKTFLCDINELMKLTSIF